MGYRDYSVKRRVSIWSENNALLMLIVLNVFVYITLRFILAVYGLSGGIEANYYKQIFEWFSMPADFSTFITRPWTLISSGFTHMDFWVMLSNMFWLWTYGFIFQDLTGNRRIFPLYLYGSVIGAGVYLLCYAIFPQLKSAPEAHLYFGAIAPIISIAIGATAFAPGYRLFPMIGGGIPLWVMTVVFLIIDIFYLTSRPAWFFPHIGAALTGFLFVQSLKSGNDWGAWMNNMYDWFVNLFNPKRKTVQRRPVKQEVFYNTRGQQPYKKTSNLTQQRIDEILDKINLKGYERLTEEEKELLKRASEEDL
jgi:membrane associated rhomboid family serine protease